MNSIYKSWSKLSLDDLTSLVFIPQAKAEAFSTNMTCLLMDSMNTAIRCMYSTLGIFLLIKRDMGGAKWNNIFG